MSRAPIDRTLRAWLRSGGSLSRQLATAFGAFEVQVLAQSSAPARLDELRLLRQASAGRAKVLRCHVREVILWGDGRPLVHARSVLPGVQSVLAWRALRGLGTRPLADLLFGLRAARCQRLGAGRMAPLQARRLAQRLRQASGGRHPEAVPAAAWEGSPLWWRRSVFTRRGVPLLVTEWFAPAVRQRAPTPCGPKRRTRTS